MHYALLLISVEGGSFDNIVEYSRPFDFRKVKLRVALILGDQGNSPYPEEAVEYRTAHFYIDHPEHIEIIDLPVKYPS